jgi:hypothetical protein
MPLTTDPTDPALGHGSDSAPVPQNTKYLVLSDEERTKGYVRPYRDTYKHTTCGQTTSMGYAIAATYATQPDFYGATYCTTCSMHRPVAEFTWVEMDGSPGPRVGS